MRTILILLLTISLPLLAQEGSASDTYTYEAPDNLEARLAALSNTEILEERCGIMDIAEITEEQLVCMESNNPIVIAHLLLLANRLELRTRLLAVGARMAFKHKTFSGVSREMRMCGFTGNHAITAWNWYRNGDLSALPCLELKKIETIAEEAVAEQLENSQKAAINTMRGVDCSNAVDVKLRTICYAIQALIK